MAAPRPAASDGYYIYDPWGGSEMKSETKANPLQYMGRYFDAHRGLYQVRARWYDPVVGRFISEDPIGLAGGINVYAYVGNSPTNMVDPSGLAPVVGPRTNQCNSQNALELDPACDAGKNPRPSNRGSDWDRGTPVSAAGTHSRPSAVPAQCPANSGWPVGSAADVTSPFSLSRRHPVTGEVRRHLGVDIAAPRGTPVYPMAAGVVVRQGWGTGGAGKRVWVEHSNGMVSRYLHLDSILVGAGVPDDVRNLEFDHASDFLNRSVREW